MSWTRSLVLAGAMAMVGVGAISIGAAGSPLHLALSKSAPSADSTVAPPAEIRLWFTLPPQDSATSIRLVNGAGEPLEIGKTTVEPEDGKVFFAKLAEPLAVGSYTVAWRTMADDGHVVRGDFAFQVRAAR